MLQRGIKQYSIDVLLDDVKLSKTTYTLIADDIEASGSLSDLSESHLLKSPANIISTRSIAHNKNKINVSIERNTYSLDNLLPMDLSDLKEILQSYLNDKIYPQVPPTVAMPYTYIASILDCQQQWYRAVLYKLKANEIKKHVQYWNGMGYSSNEGILLNSVLDMYDSHVTSGIKKINNEQLIDLPLSELKEMAKYLGNTMKNNDELNSDQENELRGELIDVLKRQLGLYFQARDDVFSVLRMRTVATKESQSRYELKPTISNNCNKYSSLNIYETHRIECDSNMIDMYTLLSTYSPFELRDMVANEEDNISENYSMNVPVIRYIYRYFTSLLMKKLIGISCFPVITYSILSVNKLNEENDTNLRKIYMDCTFAVTFDELEVKITRKNCINEILRNQAEIYQLQRWRDLMGVSEIDIDIMLRYHGLSSFDESLNEKKDILISRELECQQETSVAYVHYADSLEEPHNPVLIRYSQGRGIMRDGNDINVGM